MMDALVVTRWRRGRTSAMPLSINQRRSGSRRHGEASVARAAGWGELEG